MNKTHNINEIKDQQVRLLYQQSPFLLVSIIGLVFIVYLFFQNRVDDARLMWWTAGVLGLSVIRLTLIKQFNKRESDIDLMPWAYAFTFSALLSGMSWGILPLLILNPEQSDALILVSILLTGMCTGGLVPLSVFTPAFFVFATTTLLPLAYTLFLQPEASSSLISFMLILYLISLSGFSIVIHKNIIDSIRLRFENKGLIETVQRQKYIAEKESEDKSRFIASTSHDLRQPLQALNLYLDALQLKLKDDEAGQLLDKAKNASQALGGLFNALMDMSRLDAGMINLDIKIHNLEDIVTSLLIELRPQIENKHMSLHTNLQVALVNTDSILLTRMLRNLIINSMNHNDECDILVSIDIKDSEVKISIKDTGKGISRLELDNIFSEFYQLNNPERDRNKGLGLGLSIVKKLAQLLDIPLSVESELNQGTCFTLTLPLVDQVEVSSISEHHDIDLTGQFIMLVDDDEMVRDALKVLFKMWDCEFLLAHSEEALLAQIKAEQYPAPDVLITDYRLRDDKNGAQLIAAIRDYYKIEIPAIIITGDTLSQLNLTSCDILHKPIQSQKLQHILSQVSPNE